MRKLDLKFAWRLSLTASALALSACASGGASPPLAPGPVIPPQVAYRIDDHRYFEITPEEHCYGDMLYFVDTAKGIRSEVVKFDAVMNRTTLIIDAANDQYLVAPVTRESINCSSGGGGCGDKMPYSIDGGRTWKRVWAPSPYDKLHISGTKVYQIDEDNITRGFDLSSLPLSEDGIRWPFIHGFVFKTHIAPVDTKVLCKAQGKGSQQ